MELKQCPFCGGEVKAHKSEFFDVALLFFTCHECGAKTSFDNTTCNVGAERGDYSPTIAAWNTRHDPEQERTCTFSTYTGNGDSYPTFSSCGYEADRYECEWLQDGSMNYIGKFYINCGAKVVE